MSYWTNKHMYIHIDGQAICRCCSCHPTPLFMILHSLKKNIWNVPFYNPFLPRVFSLRCPWRSRDWRPWSWAWLEVRWARQGGFGEERQHTDCILKKMVLKAFNNPLSVSKRLHYFIGPPGLVLHSRV